MKILYAIKDKYKGVEELVTWEGVPGTVAAWDALYGLLYDVEAVKEFVENEKAKEG